MHSVMNQSIQTIIMTEIKKKIVIYIILRLYYHLYTIIPETAHTAHLTPHISHTLT